MSENLSLLLVAESIIMDVLSNFDCMSFRKMNTELPLDKLDIILSTATNFADAFSEMFGEIFDSFCLRDISEREFISFVIPRCLVLSKEKTYFNFMLVCSFMSEIVYYFICSFNCFHFAKLAYKCLFLVIKLRFEDLFKMENGWRDLLLFCEKINELVTVYSIEKTLSDNPIVNINIKKSDSPTDEPLIKQFNSFNIGDSNMNIMEDNKLQANLDGSLEDSDNLVGIENSIHNIVKDGESVDFNQELCNLSSFKEFEFTDKIGYDKPKEIEYLYELLTESHDHLNEVLDLIDVCGGEIDSYKYSTAKCDYLCGEKQKISEMVKCSSQFDVSICKCIDSKEIHSDEMKMIRGEDGPSTSPPTNTSDEESSEFSSKSSDGSLSLNASDAGNLKSFPSAALYNNGSTGPSLKVSENNQCQCCQLCKGKEDQYMMNWKKDFLKRYLEPK